MAVEDFEGIYKVTRLPIKDERLRKIDQHFSGGMFDNMPLDYLAFFEVVRDTELWIVKAYVKKIGDHYSFYDCFGNPEIKKDYARGSLVDLANSVDFFHGKGRVSQLERVATLRSLDKKSLQEYSLDKRFALN